MPRVPEPSIHAGEFERLFRTDTAARDNYRARLFALFSEEIVRAWGRNEKAPYRDMGRPTIWKGNLYATVDFLLERRADRHRFVAEQKAELAWAGYSQLRLHSPEQVARHRGKRAFDWFLEIASAPDDFVVKVGGSELPTDGAVLVWGALTDGGRSSAMAEYNFADVLSLEQMVADLRQWNDDDWRRRVAELQVWTNGLFDALIEDTTA
jgi:hypothetical protein